MASADQLQHRVDLDLRAGLDVRLPRALRPRSPPLGQAARPALPRGRLRPAGVVLKTGPGVTRGSRATEVVAHCLSVELEAPDGHNDTMLDPEQRIWGFETNFGGLADVALVKANQLMPKPDAPHLGGGRLPGPGQLPRRTASWSRKQRRRHEAGRQRPDLGRLRRPRRLRDAVRPQRRRHPGLRGLQRGEGRDRPHDGRRADHQPLRGGLQVLEGRAHPGPQGVAALRREDPRAHRRRGHRHRLRAPGPRDLRRLGLRHPQGRHDHHLRLDLAATCTSTTTATSG